MKKKKQLKTYKGNVEINSNNVKEWQEKLKDIDTISGDLSINSNAELKNLKTVGGYLYIYSNAELKNLKTVGGYLSINSNAELKAENLKTVGGDLYIYSNAELKNLKTVGGDLYINSNAELKNLKTVGGYLSINSNADRPLVRRIINEVRIKGENRYIDGVNFPEKLFTKVVFDTTTPEEVFAIENIEQRRVAYEWMDKSKMKDLKDFEVLDKKKDEKGNLMRIVSFKVNGLKKPLIFYNCFCPSTGREYFVETDKKNAKEAKDASFGLTNIEWVDEW